MSQHQHQAFSGIGFGDLEREKIFSLRREQLCDKWIPHELNTTDISIRLLQNLVGDYKISGSLSGFFASAYVTHFESGVKLHWWAANPPSYNQSFGGSGLPYPNEEIAFGGTPNDSYVDLKDVGNFEFQMVYPNSYYTNLGTKYIPPQVQLQLVNLKNKFITEPIAVTLGQGIPYRTLTWPIQRKWNNGPLFYCNTHPPNRSQEQILRDSEYPTANKVPTNFWGLKPAN